MNRLFTAIGVVAAMGLMVGGPVGSALAQSTTKASPPKKTAKKPAWKPTTRASKPSAAKPRAGKPRAGKPTRITPKDAKLKGAQPKADQPKAGQPKTGQAKTGQPKAAERQASKERGTKEKAKARNAPTAAADTGNPATGKPATGKPPEKKLPRRLTMENVNAATPDGAMPLGKQSPLTLKLQIYLDRAHFSPGVLDAIAGANVLKALKAFQQAHGLEPNGKLDPPTWRALQRAATGPVLVRYTITEQDVSEPLVARIPKDYADKARMPRMAYTSHAEMLAERFHMDIDLLKQLNFTADMTKAGTVITVAAPGPPLRKKRVTRIDVDKASGSLTARDESGRVIAFYPATVGSRQLPSPAGTHTVKVVAINPTYTYRPDVNFKQGDNDKPLTIPAGPNGPVGAIWIGLSKPTYGIHGTPDPAKIDKSNSHGCVRLTNWDAHELAHLVKKGTVVDFGE